MSNIGSSVPGFVRVGPISEYLAAVSLPRLHPSHSLQNALARAFEAPPPTPVFHTP
jgi:hypothetical protein